MYLHQYDGDFLIIVLYVDDILITGSIVASISIIKPALHDAFGMNDLGLEIAQNYDEILVTKSQ